MDTDSAVTWRFRRDPHNPRSVWHARSSDRRRYSRTPLSDLARYRNHTDRIFRHEVAAKKYTPCEPDLGNSDHRCAYRMQSRSIFQSIASSI